jgi:sugar lactone lactonase YvrE
VIGSANNQGAADGTNGTAQFTAPTGLALDSAGTAFVLDGNSVRSVVHVGTNWIVRTLTGSVLIHDFLDGTNTAARFNDPQGVAADAGGNLYVADTYNHAIRKMSLSGTNWVVTTIAGPTPQTFPPSGSADGTNNSARFDNPYGIAVDSATNIYVADTLNQTIRKVAPQGTNWVVTTLAGSAGLAGSVNASNDVARFHNPSAVAVDSQGALYVADFANNLMRKITPVGTNWAVTTLAGSTNAGAADGTGTAANFYHPQCVVLDAASNLFVTDSANRTIRKVTPPGVVSTLAGSPGVSGTADGTGSAAQFRQPYGIVVNSSGSLLVADYPTYALRQGDLAPILQCLPAGQHVVLSWSLGLTGFVPLVATSLPAKSWAPLPTNGLTIVAEYFWLTNTVGQAPNFYRLVKTLP